MNQHDQYPDDEQLNELLRQVEVPSNLKDSLRELNKEAPVNGIRPSSIPPFNSRKNLWPSLLLLAATLLGVCAFIAWPFLNNANPTDRTAKNTDPAGQTNPDTVDPTPDFQVNLEQLEDLQAQVDTMLAKLEISRLEHRLVELQLDPANQFEPKQYPSIILAMADQAVLDLGGSVESVQASMVSVIDNFPDSRGAEIAQQFLDQQPD